LPGQAHDACASENLLRGETADHVLADGAYNAKSPARYI
jgi:hypothetical protein